MTRPRRPREVRPDDVEVVPVAPASTDAEPQVVPEPAPHVPPAKPEKKPLYPRLLRLQHIHPNAWQRAALGEGAIGVGVLLSMADLASAWTILALPLAVAAIVKAHDALQGLLERGHDAAA